MNLLAPVGILYGVVTDLRNYFYDRGIFKSYDLGAQTISVGNITTGGTGKTPLVALIAEILAENGEKVCILTRGYGRKNERDRVLVSNGKEVLVDAETGGDEPVELAHKLIGKAVVVADSDRVAAAKWAKEQFEITTFILDDGFQHRRAKRDLDIVCIDATNPCGNGQILPAGTLRESFTNLKRADAVVITRADQVVDVEDLKVRLRAGNADVSAFRARTRITEIVSIEDFHAKTNSTQNNSLKDVYAFTGIGNPKNFFWSLEREGIPLTYECELEDHFRYSQEEINSIEWFATFEDAQCLVTTAKDAVKLTNLHFELPCYVAIAETVVEDEKEFRKLITSS